jgi:hypothetical protein
VQTPKFEPPPRMAQNRSAFSDSLTVRAVPFAVTTVAYIWLSKYHNAARQERRTYLEKVVDDEAMLTCEKAETPPVEGFEYHEP